VVLPAGKEIERALLVSAQRHPNITFYEHHLATDLVVDEVAGTLHCFGADVLDQRAHTMTRFIGYSTMLASGGAGQVRRQEATVWAGARGRNCDVQGLGMRACPAAAQYCYVF
jgi:aspartate oxidase